MWAPIRNSFRLRTRFVETSFHQCSKSPESDYSPFIAYVIYGWAQSGASKRNDLQTTYRSTFEELDTSFMSNVPSVRGSNKNRYAKKSWMTLVKIWKMIRLQTSMEVTMGTRARIWEFDHFFQYRSTYWTMRKHDEMM